MFLNPKGSIKTNLAEWEGDFSSLPLAEMKYERWDKAYSLLPNLMKPILENMSNLMPKENSLKWMVDYKVRDLKLGDCGCPIEGWHLDVVRNPWHKSKPDVHLLFTTEFGTDLMTTPLEIREEDIDFQQVVSRNLEYDFITAQPNTITMYGRWNLHRAPIVKRECRRVLLRLTATEVVK